MVKYLKDVGSGVSIMLSKTKIGDVATFNAAQYKANDNWSEIDYIDTGSVAKGAVNSVQRLLPGQDKVPSRARRKVRNGSIIYSTVRPNQCHYALLENPKPNTLVSTGFTVIDCDESIVLPHFCYYLLTQSSVVDFFQGLAEQSASTYPTLNPADIASLKVDIPSLDTQAKTVALINSIDKKIELNTRINDYLAELGVALFNNTCPQTNDPNAVLSDVAEITMGQSPSGSSYNEDGDGEVFYQGRGEFGTYFPRRRLFTTEPKRMAQEGDTLMSVRAPVGDLNVANEKCCIGRGLAAIHSNSAQSFVHYLMYGQARQLDAFNGDGTVFGSINGKALKELPV